MVQLFGHGQNMKPVRECLIKSVFILWCYAIYEYRMYSWYFIGLYDVLLNFGGKIQIFKMVLITKLWCFDVAQTKSKPSWCQIFDHIYYNQESDFNLYMFKKWLKYFLGFPHHRHLSPFYAEKCSINLHNNRNVNGI